MADWSSSGEYVLTKPQSDTVSLSDKDTGVFRDLLDRINVISKELKSVKEQSKENFDTEQKNNKFNEKKKEKSEVKTEKKRMELFSGIKKSVETMRTSVINGFANFGTKMLGPLRLITDPLQQALGVDLGKMFGDFGNKLFESSKEKVTSVFKIGKGKPTDVEMKKSEHGRALMWFHNKTKKKDKDGGSFWESLFGGASGGIGGILAKALPLIGGIGAIIAGVVWMVVDFFRGMCKSGDWGVSKVAGGIGGALGGMSSGLEGAFKNAGKFALIGAGIGTLIYPIVGTIVGGLIGAGIGALIGYIGGENIAKALQGKMNEFTNIIKSDKSIDEKIIGIFQSVINGLLDIGTVAVTTLGKIGIDMFFGIFGGMFKKMFMKKGMSEEDATNVLAKIKERIKEVFGNVIHNIFEILNAPVKFITEFIPNMIADVTKDLKALFSDPEKGFVQKFLGVFKVIFSNIGENFKDMFDFKFVSDEIKQERKLRREERKKVRLLKKEDRKEERMIEKQERKEKRKARFEAIKDSISSFKDGLISGQIFKDIFNGIKTSISGFFGTEFDITKFFDPTKIFDTMFGTNESGNNDMRAKVDEIWGKFSNFVNGFVEDLKKSFSNAFSGIVNFWNYLKYIIEKPLERIPQAFDVGNFELYQQQVAEGVEQKDIVIGKEAQKKYGEKLIQNVVNNVNMQNAENKLKTGLLTGK